MLSNEPSVIADQYLAVLEIAGSVKEADSESRALVCPSRRMISCVIINMTVLATQKHWTDKMVRREAIAGVLHGLTPQSTAGRHQP